jgi:hypothetical protein
MLHVTAVMDVCSQLTILHFSRILPLPHPPPLSLSLSFSLTHEVEGIAGSQSCSAGRLQTYFQAVNINFKLKSGHGYHITGMFTIPCYLDDRKDLRNTLYRSPLVPGCRCKVFICIVEHSDSMSSGFC